MTQANSGEFTRYIINGLIATAVHFLVLSICLQILQLPSAGLSNMLAAAFGISASFLGSRFYVYPKATAPIWQQAARFAVLYVSIALLHGAVLYLWTDLYSLDYRVGFLIATVIQFCMSYFGNKYLVFRQ
jgi:putative flippase GtrA